MNRPRWGLGFAFSSGARGGGSLGGGAPFIPVDLLFIHVDICEDEWVVCFLGEVVRCVVFFFGFGIICCIDVVLRTVFGCGLGCCCSGVVVIYCCCCLFFGVFSVNSSFWAFLVFGGREFWLLAGLLCGLGEFSA